MHTMIDCISGVETVEPYCDVSLRVIMRMADILMFRHQYKIYNIEDKEEVIEGLMEFQTKNYKKQKNKELEYWLDMP